MGDNTVHTVCPSFLVPLVRVTLSSIHNIFICAQKLSYIQKYSFVAEVKEFQEKNHMCHLGDSNEIIGTK